MALDCVDEILVRGMVDEINRKSELPNATGKSFNELATDGSGVQSYEWSPFRMTPKTISGNYTVPAGANASIGSFTLEDNFNITVEDGASLIIIG